MSEYICIDNLNKVKDATSLYREALQFVEKKVSESRDKPRMVFCSTEECDNAFGLGRRAAYTVSSFGIIISKRGWKPYYVRHEIIHHIQFETLGTVKAWLFTPEWFMEGMPYYLSEDPRSPLSDRYEAAREKFKKWYVNHNEDDVWAIAAQL